MLSATLFVGRICGLIREIQLISAFGISNQADIAIVILSIPDLIVNFVISGGISFALIPALKELKPPRRTVMLFQVLGISISVCTLAAVAFCIQPVFWFSILAPGVNINNQFLDWLDLLSIGISIPLTAASGVFTSALNAEGKFFLAGLGTLIFNLTIILLLSVAPLLGREPLHLICLGIGLGSLCRVGNQLSSIHSLYTFQFSKLSAEWCVSLQFIKNFVTGLVASLIQIILPIVMRSCSSILGEGKIAAFNYAIKISEVPIAVLVVAFQTVAYTRLCEAFSNGSSRLFYATIINSVVRTIGVSFGVVLFGWQYSDALVDLLFSFKNIKQEMRLEMVSLIQMAVLSVPFIAISGILTSASNARRKFHKTLYGNLFGLIMVAACLAIGVSLKSSQVIMLSLSVFNLFIIFYLVMGSHLKTSKRIAARLVVPIIGLLVIYSGQLLFDKTVLVNSSENVVHRSVIRVIFASVVFCLILFVWAFLEKIIIKNRKLVW